MRTQFSLISLLLLVTGCALSHHGLDGHYVTDGTDSLSTEGGGDVVSEDSPLPDTIAPDSDNDADVLVADATETDADVIDDQSPDAVDVVDATDAFEAGVDVTDITPPADVVVPTDVVTPMDVIVPTDVPVVPDAGPTPIMRYEFRILDSADPSATDPMHLKIRDTVGGAGWLRITCLNALPGDSTVMVLVPGIPGGYRRCDTDTRYPAFVFDYQSTLNGSNTNTIGGGGCLLRAGFQARIYDLRISSTTPVADQTTLGLDCSGAYWTHTLP